jgi:hypothetical protein
MNKLLHPFKAQLTFSLVFVLGSHTPLKVLDTCYLRSAIGLNTQLLKFRLQQSLVMFFTLHQTDFAKCSTKWGEITVLHLRRQNN